MWAYPLRGTPGKSRGPRGKATHGGMPESSLKRSQLEKVYRRTGTIRGTARELGRGVFATRSALIRHGLHQPQENGKRGRVNDAFFSKLTPRSAYWLGMLASDGNIGDDHLIALKLKLADRPLVQRFRTDLGAQNPLRERDAVLNGRRYPQVTVEIRSQAICRDLRKYGIGPRKSLTLEYPPALRGHPLAHFFCRGLVDGDGGWYLENPKSHRRGWNEKPYLRFSLAGTPSILHGVLAEMAREEIVTEEKTQKKALKKAGRASIFAFTGNPITEKIGRWLYQDLLAGDTLAPVLERKWKRWRDWTLRREWPDERIRLAP